MKNTIIPIPDNTIQSTYSSKVITSIKENAQTNEEFDVELEKTEWDYIKKILKIDRGQ